MKIFTLSAGQITPGAMVKEFGLTGGAKIDAILCGQRGRGRNLGVLPVTLLGDRDKDSPFTNTIVTETRSGRPKLIEVRSPDTGDHVLVVMMTQPGFRGSCGQAGDIEPRDPGLTGDDRHKHKSFPGHILVTGWTAQGTAGRMGGGPQIVTIIPRAAVFCEKRSGRLYGSPSVHYYVWTGEKMLTATHEERQLSDIF